ncbi:MAG: hypothetical protein ACXVY9_00150, partial [Terriglobales bacterium]
MKFTLAVLIALITLALVTVGTLWPQQTTTVMYIAGEGTGAMATSKTPEGAVQSVIDNVKKRQYHGAYSYIANTNQVDEREFTDDMRGTYGSLRTYSNLEDAELRVLRKTDSEAVVRTNMRWATAVGAFYDTRDLKVVNRNGEWKVVWPEVKETKAPPQVIPVNYLRWDVIYRGSADDWGSQDVEAPHVRIVAMHPVDRAGGVIIMGEILNEDVVPAFVTVKATLLDSKGEAIATEDSFDKILHVLLPKQVSPFRIDFRNVRMSQVDSVRMQPSSNLVPASADPVIGIESQKLNPVPDSSLTGQLVNQSGQVVNVAHVIGTFYDASGQIVWVGDEYPSHALLPQTPMPFQISVPADVSAKAKTYRTVATSYI